MILEMSSIYEVDLSFYNEMKYDVSIECPRVLMSMAKEMIYYNHWSNLVMFEFLNSCQNLDAIIESLEIKTMEDYFASGSLF
jgi:hypothetical protein